VAPCVIPRTSSPLLTGTARLISFFSSFLPLGAALLGLTVSIRCSPAPTWFWPEPRARPSFFPILQVLTFATRGSSFFPGLRALFEDVVCIDARLFGQCCYSVIFRGRPEFLAPSKPATNSSLADGFTHVSPGSASFEPLDLNLRKTVQPETVSTSSSPALLLNIQVLPGTPLTFLMPLILPSANVPPPPTFQSA